LIKDEESMPNQVSDTAANELSVSKYSPSNVVQALLHADKAALCAMYWLRHPRFRFLKSVPANASVLDVGCGSGGTSYWPAYMEPDRSDIHLHGVDIAKGEHAHRLASFSLVDLNAGSLPFAESHFQAAMSAHVLEHLTSGRNTFKELWRCLAVGAQLYIEVPSLASALPPRAEAFKQAGWPMMISNFFDDGTHITLWEPAALIGQAQDAGFKLRTQGVVNDRFLEDTLMAAGIDRRDEELMLYGFWSKSDWSDYFIFERMP
jgi:SAM-dependent methyltransferase